MDGFYLYLNINAKLNINGNGKFWVSVERNCSFRCVFPTCSHHDRNIYKNAWVFIYEFSFKYFHINNAVNIIIHSENEMKKMGKYICNFVAACIHAILFDICCEHEKPPQLAIGLVISWFLHCIPLGQVSGSFNCTWRAPSLARWVPWGMRRVLQRDAVSGSSNKIAPS